MQPNDLLWVEKYRPKKIGDLIDNEEAKTTFLEWLKSKHRKKKAVLLYGPPGVGKTALVNIAAHEFGFTLIEMNASDARSEKAVNDIGKPATSYASLNNFTGSNRTSGNLLFLDEVDGIAGTEDRGGVNAIIKIIEGTLAPVIMAANDPDIDKLRPLKKECLLIRFHQIRIPLLILMLQKICHLEHVKAEFEAIERIAVNSRGDVRSAINDLQSLSEVTRSISLQDTILLTSRNKDLTFDETLNQFFSAKSITQASNLLSYSNVDYDSFLLSVSDNLPRRFSDPVELAAAYNLLSAADMFRGRINTENWHLLKYFFNELTKIPTATAQPYKPFELIFPPIRIITLFWTKGKRNMLNTICDKIGRQCHVSSIKAKENLVPYIKMILLKKKNTAFVEWFKFTPEEVDFLLKTGRF